MWSRILKAHVCKRAALAVVTAVAGTAVAVVGYDAMNGAEEVQLSNFSNTHQVHTTRYYMPSTVSELEALVHTAHKVGQSLRPVGSGLSPNGIGFNADGMISLANLNSLLHVDEASKQVTVEAGMRVTDLVRLLKPYGLTLQNFASIAEQQLGGITQVSAHGTGATIPPIDEQVVAMKIVTPGRGTLYISREKHPKLFPVLQVGLGALGIVAEVTLQCVNDHVLVERTLTLNHSEIRQHHHRLLRENLHVKYLWIPYTDCVIVVTCNPLDKEGYSPGFSDVSFPEEDKLQKARELLHSLSGESREYIDQMTFTQLRDELLYINPLDTAHIIAVNNAEAEFWKKNIGKRADLSDRILGFDCGGEQRVMEVAFPTGTLNNPTGADLEFAFELLRMIEREKIPAPSPLEQRWTSRSRGILSPAYSENPDLLFSWLGIIMYLPPEKENRRAVHESFDAYTELCRQKLWLKYKCRVHWAKLEVPSGPEVVAMKQALREQYDLDQVKRVKQYHDPHHILDNHLTKLLFDE